MDPSLRKPLRGGSYSLLSMLYLPSSSLSPEEDSPFPPRAGSSGDMRGAVGGEGGALGGEGGALGDPSPGGETSSPPSDSCPDNNYNYK